MLNLRVIGQFLILISSILVVPQTFADTSDTSQQLSDIKALKLQLYNDLNNGDIRSSTFDTKTELDIAKTQMGIAQYYLAQGDKKFAAISAIIARKILQGIYNTPNDPRLIPVYSLLVQIYDSSIDTDTPNVDASNATEAKLYREAIDHIHAQ